MREDTIVAENTVLALARIATQLREIAAELDSIAVAAVTQENQGTIVLPERILNSHQEEKERPSEPVTPAPKTSRQATGPQFRPAAPRFGGGISPFLGFLGGMGGGNPLASLLGGGMAGGANPMAALLGGGIAGGANPMAALLGGGMAGGANPMAALLGGGMAGGANPMAALLGGGTGGGNIFSLFSKDANNSPLAALLGKNGDLSSLLKDPETLGAVLSGDKSALEKLKNQKPSTGEKESSGSNSQPTAEPAPQQTGNPQPGQPGAPQGAPGNPAHQPPYQPGPQPFYQPRYPMSSPYYNMQGHQPFGMPFVPQAFSFSAARAVRTPTPADAQYLDALLRKWRIF